MTQTTVDNEVTLRARQLGETMRFWRERQDELERQRIAIIDELRRAGYRRDAIAELLGTSVKNVDRIVGEAKASGQLEDKRYRGTR